ncbi:hypothetical protein [Chitinolyticbacter meiyuanensis]|uniref:hypothetical protein n=1 Tax=Chitinolyticbacter meiyuanensis TaxID=682798 RepID=UPI0011E5DE0F|nr:hypothetical protein [Chitinolyticbacter meiyuanensis]
MAENELSYSGNYKHQTYEVQALQDGDGWIYTWTLIQDDGSERVHLSDRDARLANPSEAIATGIESVHDAIDTTTR